MKKLYLGIDIGLEGGIAGIDQEHQLVFVESMPLEPDKITREINIQKFAGIISSLNQQYNLIHLIEEPIAMPKINNAAIGTSFKNFGILYTILKLHLGIVNTIKASTWSPKLCGSKPKGMSYSDDKKRKALIAKQLFYGVGWMPSSNKEALSQADAILIAEYNFRENTGIDIQKLDSRIYTAVTGKKRKKIRDATDFFLGE